MPQDQQYVWVYVFVPALLYYMLLFSSRVEHHWGILSGLELSQPILVVGNKGWLQQHDDIKTRLKEVEAILHLNNAVTTVSNSANLPTNKTFYTLYHPLESVIRATDSRA